MKNPNCEECGHEISWGIYRYSMQMTRGKGFCMKCQKVWRLKNMPERLAHFINGQVDKGM